jgi:carnosine N-methyltransferase
MLTAKLSTRSNTAFEKWPDHLLQHRQYRKNAHHNCTHRRRQNLYAVPQWKTLAAPPFSLLDNLNAVDDAIDNNAEIAEAIVELGLQAFDISETLGRSDSHWHNTAKVNDFAKAHSTIRQFYRDWSAEGALERDLVTSSVLEDLRGYLPSGRRNVLLPGAGIGRLVFDLTYHGYNATGNEISYHQLLASNWVLNHTMHAKQYALYPFATTFTNLRSRSQQLKEVQIPDVHPATALAERLRNGDVVGEMNMHAGDFATTYTSTEQRSSFDAVVSIFFIDTAPNLIKYIEAVRNCLADGGIWINVGPLLWHFDEQSIKQSGQNHSREGGSRKQNLGIAEPGSFELTDEEVILLVQKMGFDMVTHDVFESGPGLGYIQDPESMLQNLYQCSHWVVRKRAEITT